MNRSVREQILALAAAQIIRNIVINGCVITTIVLLYYSCSQEVSLGRLHDANIETLQMQEYFEKWNPNVDYRENPHLYNIGRGQQGVLLCEPYKSEICAHWRFKTPEEAEISSQKIYSMFLDFIEQGDFVGADMAKKFLHMGFTRARRYANHRDGKKYAPDGTVLPQEPDAMTCDKAESAVIFREMWKLARENKTYLQMKKKFKESKS